MLVLLIYCSEVLWIFSELWGVLVRGCGKGFFVGFEFVLSDFKVGRVREIGIKLGLDLVMK